MLDKLLEKIKHKQAEALDKGKRFIADATLDNKEKAEPLSFSWVDKVGY